MKNDALKKLSEETRKAIATAIASNAVASLIAHTKEAAEVDSGTFNVIASTADRDRQNEIVLQDGWDLSFYKLNPVVLWAHDYSSMPIGVCTEIAVIDGKLQAKGKFAPASANPFAQQIRMLYDLGFVKTVSVGFIPTEYDTNDRDVVTKAQLLEFSFVPVPANPYALTQNQVKELGIDMTLLKTKGLEFNIKTTPVIGDACQLDDGTPGILGKNPNNPDGTLVCIPAKAYKDGEMKEAEEELSKAMEAHKEAHKAEHETHAKNHDDIAEVMHKAISDYHKDSEEDEDDESHKAEGDSEFIPHVIKEAMEAHKTAVKNENMRHKDAMDSHHKTLCDAMDAYKECVKDIMKDYPSESGDDVGGNATADSVRMQKTIKEVYSNLTTACAALKDYAESEGGKKTADDETVVPAGKVENSKSNSVSGDIERYIAYREVVRKINIAFGKALRDFNHLDNNRK